MLYLLTLVNLCNFVIFHPSQHKLDYEVNIKIIDNDSYQMVSLERKTIIYVKYLGVLFDSNLSWKDHNNFISLKISKGIGIIASLINFEPLTTLFKHFTIC